MSKMAEYPHEVEIKRKMKLVIKPLEIKDIPAQMKFFKTLPEQDLIRLPHDVLEKNYPKRMKRQIEDNRVVRLVAWKGKEIVGSLALYRGTSRWIEHTGSVVLVTHPKYRRYGVGTVLFDEMIPLARSFNIEKIYANVLEDHKEAIRLFKNIGFKREALLHHHVKDSYNRYLNLRIYSIDLEAANKAMEDLISQFADYSG